MNRVSILTVVFLVLMACGSSGNEEATGSGKGIVVSGKVGFPQQQGVITIEKMQGNQFVAMDTITLAENYTYSHALDLTNPDIYRMNFYGKQFVPVILDSDNVSINVDGNSRTGFFEIVGSSDHDLINQVQAIRGSLNTSPEFNELNKAFNEARQTNDMQKMEDLQAQYMKMADGISKQIAALLKDTPASLAKSELLKTGGVIDKDAYFDVYLKVAEQLSEAYPESDRVIEFSNMVNEMKRLAIGQPAPDIALPNPDGEVVSLSSLRGKYVLVDFWAKWCKPCRAENPNVVRMYQKYNEKGFEVFGVSLDRNRSDWLQAIEEDNLTWTHVSDLKFWNSEAAKIYGITAIPFAVLLDPEGTIIAKNLRGRALEDKLSELLD